jgi:hypothetical protein
VIFKYQPAGREINKVKDCPGQPLVAFRTVTQKSIDASFCVLEVPLIHGRLPGIRGVVEKSGTLAYHAPS